MEAVPEAEEEEELLEINLISAQDLKPAIGLRRMQTYAVAWVDPSAKLRTRIDRTGGPNPTWNDRFIFRVPRSFLDDAGDGFGSPAVSIEIYAVGCIVDSLVGAVRLLIGNLRLLSRPQRNPSFAAVQVRRESGRFQGVLNVAAMLLSLAPAAAEAPAIGYRDSNKSADVFANDRESPPNSSSADCFSDYSLHSCDSAYVRKYGTKQ
ncbi:hypothetical protein QJS10_CPB20g02098 [Acorus calamus]|uniref:C2 domain-containing protein n=1 Tax=Acorus calamus TaxID=4465 RepID=A0AAV9CEQ5_ACOCL|nr:hypothetical protein QJS10_CPB20g02098 [Acorus calamus]